MDATELRKDEVDRKRIIVRMASMELPATKTAIRSGLKIGNKRFGDLFDEMVEQGIVVTTATLKAGGRDTPGWSISEVGSGRYQSVPERTGTEGEVGLFRRPL